MQFKIIGRHIEITEAIRMHAEEKTAKLSKYYDSINQVEVIIDGKQGGSVNVEVIARAEHSNVFVVKENGDDIFKCIDIAAHKMEQQLKKKKGKERDNKH